MLLFPKLETTRIKVKDLFSNHSTTQNPKPQIGISQPHMKPEKNSYDRRYLSLNPILHASLKSVAVCLEFAGKRRSGEGKHKKPKEKERNEKSESKYRGMKESMSKNSPKLEDRFKLIASGILRQNRCLHSRWKLDAVSPENEGGGRRRKERHTAAVMAAGGRQEEEKETMKEEGDRIIGE